MKNICSINTDLPTLEDILRYYSNASLLDYDIVLFDSELPLVSIIEFSGGGSCIAIECGKTLVDAICHWSAECKRALHDNKTVFVLLNREPTVRFNIRPNCGKIVMGLACFALLASLLGTDSN